jgi:molybdenum cofactor cytidylyltransferase
VKFGPVPLDQAIGKILAHNVAGPDGRRLLRKGRPLTAEDVESLRRAGRASVYVAELQPGDVDEDAAARRVALAAMGWDRAPRPQTNLKISGPASGRANLLSTALGVLRVDAARLAGVNECDGITLATLLTHTVVRPRQMVATVKVIPFAVPEATVQAAERMASVGSAAPGDVSSTKSSGVLWVDALTARPVSLILSGSPSIHEKLLDDFAPLTDRVAALGSQVTSTHFVSLEDESGETALAEQLRAQKAAGARLIVLAGETAIMDRHDIVPRAVERAGGRVECVGAPVDPGNLLMLGYLGDVPVLGAPGCARSRKVNIVDWVLPRLLAGDRLTRADIFALGHGGLLEDAPERPQPRSRVE